MARSLKIRDLTLRDGQQSSFATRMTQEQINRCLPYYKDAGFFAMEVWGGAVPDSVMRYLGENPWTRLESIHKEIGDISKLTALSRGRNLFGYAPYTDEIIDGFSRNAIQSGLGIMRIFDALNDVDNVKSTIKYVKRYGGIADCAVCYTVHILVIDKVSPKVDGVMLSMLQFLVAGVISAVPMLLFEDVSVENLIKAAPSIAYSGIMSSGVAYTLQILGQQKTEPTIATMIMSLESVFGVLTAMIILHQVPTVREGIGCILMFAAIIVAQLPEKKKV